MYFETASESRLVVSAHRADRVGKDTQVPKERAVKVREQSSYENKPTKTSFGGTTPGGRSGKLPKWRAHACTGGL